VGPNQAVAPGPTEAVVLIRIAALLHLLDEYPAQLTVDDLLREVAGSARDFAEEDQLRRAVRDLEHGGLLRLHGPFVVPTRPAINFHRLARST
jgi:hypothetical protein